MQISRETRDQDLVRVVISEEMPIVFIRVQQVRIVVA